MQRSMRGTPREHEFGALQVEVDESPAVTREEPKRRNCST